MLRDGWEKFPNLQCSDYWKMHFVKLLPHYLEKFLDNFSPETFSPHEKQFLEKKSPLPILLWKRIYTNRMIYRYFNRRGTMKGFPEIREKAKRTSWNSNMKDSFMARYCYNYEHDNNLKDSLSLWVQFSGPVANIYFLSKKQSFKWTPFSFNT